ncbi:hypothetical protein [Bradyrhizobium sp.]|uniref:hypothetical protein n=1 Tax=Bradyrhizobium sp. TaxID=376 RepID=UPI001EC49D26|nr:hypothetical protein [Bradyrhizobium sp.]MBV9984644.1 hypothetical protein [Bradyrhizobium sp.]
MKPILYLSGRLASAPVFPSFDAGVASVPFDNNPLAPDQLSLQPHSGTTAAPGSVRALSSRFEMLNRGGARHDGATTPSIPIPSPAQNGWSPAPADRRPVPEYQAPPPPSVYGLPDRDADNMEDWFKRCIKPLFEP